MVSKSEIKLIRALKAKKQRDKLNLFIAEGVKLVEHFIDNGLVATHIFCSEAYIGALKERSNVVSIAEMKQLSHLDSASPVLAVFEKPSFKANLESNMLLALDDVRDPGNMGTIIRLADWFGVPTIFCSPNCVDVFNTKSIQSTMGSLANVQIVSKNLSEVFSLAKAEGFEIVGAEMNGTLLNDFERPSKLMLVLGNEANGISLKNQNELTSSITIAKAGSSKAESLNVAMAGAILLGKLS